MNERDNERVLRVVTWNPQIKDLLTPDEVLEKVNAGHVFERVCPYCGNIAKVQDASVVYGRKYAGQDLLICTDYPNCDSYVGCHTKGYNVGLPLGTLANRELRELRKICHNQYFDPLWKDGDMDRDDAYDYLQAVMGMSSFHAHIAMFSVDDCRKFIHMMNTRAEWDLDFAKKQHNKSEKSKTGRGWGNVPDRRKPY